MQSSVIEPRLIKRYRGGWLALMPEGASLQFGVTAWTEAAIRLKFAASLKSWQEILKETKL